MPPRTLASLAHALSAASDLDTALVSLAEALAEIDRSARVSVLLYDGRRALLRERLVPMEGHVERVPVGTTIDHLSTRLREQVLAGGDFADFGDQSDEAARLLGVSQGSDGGLLGLRGLRIDGQLAAVVALYESRRIFGTRVMERFGPYAALFDLAFARFADREAREEAVRTLEDVTQRVHGEYLRKLGSLEHELAGARAAPLDADTLQPGERLAIEREREALREDARRAGHKAEGLEQQLMAAVDQLERAHVELHRRSEVLRQKIRTLYLIDRVLTLDASTQSAHELGDGLVALMGDDMQAQRCSLMLVAPDGDGLYLAAARGLPPDVGRGYRVAFGEGVVGKVAETREPLLVTDVQDAGTVPMLRDQYFTTGSFISFPLVYHGVLIGVVNLTNRAQRGIYFEEDVERVRLLALLVALIASQAQLPERLMDTIRVG